MEYKDYYKILGVERDADLAKIKSAYRKLARKYHPDVNKSPDAVNKFKDINEAYEVLSDKDKKARYDSLGANWQEGANFTPPPGFEGFNFNQGGYSQDFSGGFSDFFSSIFGDILNAQGASRAKGRSSGTSYEDIFSQGGFNQYGGKTSSKPPKSENLDVTQDLNVTAADLMSNMPISVKQNTFEKCTKCSGVGSNCYECGGTGVKKQTKVLNVKIPRGIKEGQKIRLAGEGKSDEYGRKGDLYFVLRFKDSEYSIKDDNLIKNVEITPSEAVFGCTKNIETLHGKINIKIPQNSRTGQMLRLKNLGLPLKTGGYGNLNVKIMINLPKELTNKQKELYKQLLELEK
ncbi:DnaJ domain-containing protein [bacterium]|nr:DnaJ domain-containing protein [bacterium]